MKIKNLPILVLTIMIAYDLSLHLSEMLGLEAYWWLQLPSREAYTLFWTIYWGIGLILIVWSWKILRRSEET